MDVRGSPLSEEPTIASQPRCGDAVVGCVDQSDCGLFDLLPRDFLGCDQLARVRELDRATRLRLQLGCGLVRSVCRSVVMVGVVTMVSLLFAIAVADDQTSHRVANVQNHAGRARGYERNRKR